MKKLYALIIAGTFFIGIQKSQAQDGFDQLIKSSPADATKLVSAYGLPLFKGFGTGLNSGWNNTAKTKKLLHFDLRITAAIAMVPNSDKSFDVTKIGLSNHVVPTSASNTIAPTFAGSKLAGPNMTIKDDNGNTVGNFDMPKGLISVIPAPNIQLTVGLVHNTDITIRAIPTTKISGDIGSVGMIGFGIKHDIIQDFAKKLPKPFDLAIAFGYNKLTYKKDLNVKPDAGALPLNASQSSDFSNQRIEGHFSGVNVSAILSKKLAVFTPFISVAYQTASTDIAAIGNYPVTSNAIAGQKFYTTYNNPVTINQNSLSGLRTDLGFQLNLAIFRVYVSGSLGEYKSVNGGIGFGF
ncbi:DUF6588 family protein [Mucilaginibacter boryungensis]|uniref:Uncharacterized protein n=1 Tax=Mucilaginibacter boryungensis TaxID=768480 RepID=A0ABR9XER0_9SPHI|nr:DUF6588 family protein [Mucilaginibacter boryungensis]MBE9665677.1 hypothetical protein [Mucilaginibacter boryungensis]